MCSGAGPDGTPTDVRLSELFAPGRDSLVIYNMMFPRHPTDERPGPRTGQTARLPLLDSPCPSCTALLDQLDGAAEHVAQRELRSGREGPDRTRPRVRRGARLAPSPAVVVRRQHVQARLPRRIGVRGATADAQRVPPRRRRRSATSGARSSCTNRATPARTRATSERSSRSGTSSISSPRAATRRSTSRCSTAEP